jgi:integrase
VVERTAHNQYLASNATEYLSNLSTRLKSKAIPTADKLPYKDQRVIKLYTDLPDNELGNTLRLFIVSRKVKTSELTLLDYLKTLSKTLPVTGLHPTVSDLTLFQKKLANEGHKQGGIDDYYKNFSAFYNWYFSPKSELTTEEQQKQNPMPWVERAGRPKLELNWHTVETVNKLIESVPDTSARPPYQYQARDRAIIAMLPESGLRLEEISVLRINDIDFEKRRIRVRHGKGDKPRKAPFGNLTARYLKSYMETIPDKKGEDYLWTTGNGKDEYLTNSGVGQMLARMNTITGIHCNAHSFRRTFAIWLRLEGVDLLVIRDLGGWESVEMVERYTRSFDREQSLRFYKSPYGNSIEEFKAGDMPSIIDIADTNLKIDFSKLPKDLLAQLAQYTINN